MRIWFSFHLILIIFLGTILISCGGSTKHVIPSEIPIINNGMARIIATRERQFSGSAISTVLIDIGDDINANSVIKYKMINPKIGLSRVVYFWCNPEKLTQVYCDDSTMKNQKELKDEIYEKGGSITLGENKDSIKAQVIGKLYVGDTIIWDRKPGKMHLITYAMGWGHISNEIVVEADKTYYIRTPIMLWELEKTE